MSDAIDPFNLVRFVDAQNGVLEEVRSELRHGRKTSHWIWFIFPQLAGLGHSAMAQRYAISSRKEAEAYSVHPTLRPRLDECTQLVTTIQGRSIKEILGVPDDIKFRSSMTLFAHVCEDNQIFVDAINKYFGGDFDLLTLERL